MLPGFVQVYGRQMGDRELGGLVLAGASWRDRCMVRPARGSPEESRAGRIWPTRSAVSLNAQDLCDLLVQ